MDLKCDCGKIVGKYRNGKFYLYCKRCKMEVEVTIDDLKYPENFKEIKINKVEPKSRDSNIKALL